MSESTEGRRITLGILAHLRENPDAQDTLEGIAQWWLDDADLSARSRLVERAVEALVAEGWLQRILGPDSRERYRANPARRSEIARTGS